MIHEPGLTPGDSPLSPHAPRPRWRVQSARTLLTSAAAAGVALQHGFDHPPFLEALGRDAAASLYVHVIHAAQLLLMGAYLLDVWLRTRRNCVWMK